MSGGCTGSVLGQTETGTASSGLTPSRPSEGGAAVESSLPELWDGFAPASLAEGLRFSRWHELLLRVLWPGRCASCKGKLEGLSLFCPCCARDVALMGWFEPPASIALAHALFVYDGPVSEAIRQWKFDGREAVGRAFEDCLLHSSRRLARCLPSKVLVVPVPAHPTKLRQRGFDAVMGCARAVTRGLRKGACDARLSASSLRRVRATRAQVELDQEQREQNLIAAFECSGRVEEAVILVDDVVTTGATASACGRTLLAAGVEWIALLSIARASPELRGHGSAVPVPPHFSEEF